MGKGKTMKKIHINGSEYGVAFFEANRNINPNNVKSHKKSLKECGNLTPLTYIKADAEQMKDKKIVDATDGSEVAEDQLTNYIVVVDGQHRYKAARELEEEGNFDMDALTWSEVNVPEGKTVEDVLVEINSVGQKWKGNDYVAGYALRHNGNEIVCFAKELADEGVTSKTINKYLFFNEKFSWANPDEEKLKKANLARAKQIWNVVKTFPKNVKTKSCIIDDIIAEGNWNATLDKVKGITDEDKEKLGKIKKVQELKVAYEKLMA